jgi:hypothetical protein
MRDWKSFLRKNNDVLVLQASLVNYFLINQVLTSRIRITLEINKRPAKILFFYL